MATSVCTCTGHPDKSDGGHGPLFVVGERGRLTENIWGLAEVPQATEKEEEGIKEITQQGGQLQGIPIIFNIRQIHGVQPELYIRI